MNLFTCASMSYLTLKRMKLCSVERGQMNMVEGKSLYQNVILKLMNMFRELFEHHHVSPNVMSHITKSVSYDLWKECYNDR